METYDTYGLVPDGMDLAEVLDRLFRFEGVVYHDGHADHRIHGGAEAASAFSRRMRDGDHIRFHVSTIDRTRGGWLYRLTDGSAVVGLSGAAGAPAAEFVRALEASMPGCRCCTVGDEPPPMTRAEFMRAVGAKT